MLSDSVASAIEDRRRIALKEGNAKSPWIFPRPRRSPNASQQLWASCLESGTEGTQDPAAGIPSRAHTSGHLLLNSGASRCLSSQRSSDTSRRDHTRIYAHVMTADIGRHRNAFDQVLKIG